MVYGWNNTKQYRKRLFRADSERRTTATVLIQRERYAVAEDYIDKLREQKIPTESIELYLIKTINNSGDVPRAKLLFNKWIKPTLSGKESMPAPLRSGPLK